MLKTVNGAPSAQKTPGSVVDFAIDWRAWLASGEVIENSVWTCEPALPLTGPGLAGGLAVVFVGGGVDGTTYRLKNAITTNGGRQDSRTIVLRCTADRA